MSEKRKYVGKPAKKNAKGWIHKNEYECTLLPLLPFNIASLKATNSPLLKYLSPIPDKKVVTPSKSIKLLNPYVSSVKKPSGLTKQESTNLDKEARRAVDDIHTLANIKASHKLFFTYDPRGYKPGKLPVGYCEFCLCPDEYCAEIVFGVMTTNHSLTKAYGRSTTWNLEEKCDMKRIFDEAYTEAVYSKLRWNGFDLNEEQIDESYHQIKIPRCMKMGSLKKFYKMIQRNNDREAEIGCQSCYGDDQAMLDEAIERGEFETLHSLK